MILVLTRPRSSSRRVTFQTLGVVLDVLMLRELVLLQQAVRGVFERRQCGRLTVASRLAAVSVDGNLSLPTIAAAAAATLVN